MDARRVRRAVAAAVVAAAASAAVVLSVAAGTAAAGGTPSVSLPATPLLGVVRATGAAAGSTSPALKSFGSCRWLADYFRTEVSSREMLCRIWGCYKRGVRVRPNVIAATSTNVQVEGVDEPDIIKGNGSVQYLVSKGHFYVLAVRSRGAEAVRVGSVKVGQAKALLADGSSMLVIGRPSSVTEGPDAGWTVTRLTRVDASTLEAPVITSTVDVQGRIVASRSIGGTARLVIKTNILPALSKKVQPLDNLTAVAEFVAALPGEAWAPTYTLRRFPVGGGEPTVTTAPLASCARTYRPRVFEGWVITTVLALPVDEVAYAGDFGSAAELPGGVAVVSGAGVIYASRKAVYVTSERGGTSSKPQTDVHAFSIEGPSAVYVASTNLAGRLLNQWAFYQRRDILFVATTLSPRSRVASSSTLSALKVQGRTFTTVGTVPRIGVGEAITAVRYLGDLAFVVTFREVDPLYAIDLRDPSRMVTLGALKVPGFSRYLQPLAPGLLLGLGVSVRPGRRVAKASLFRVPSAATVDNDTRLGELAVWTPPPIAGRPLSYGSSWQADTDHRAFLYLPARRLIIAPMDVRDREGGRTEATLLRVAPDGAGFTLVARVTHQLAGKPAGRITRAVVIDGRYLWTVAPGGVEVRDLDTLLVTSRAEL